jgi:hypothetical protein
LNYKNVLDGRAKQLSFSHHAYEEHRYNEDNTRQAVVERRKLASIDKRKKERVKKQELGRDECRDGCHPIKVSEQRGKTRVRYSALESQRKLPLRVTVEVMLVCPTGAPAGIVPW